MVSSQTLGAQAQAGGQAVSEEAMVLAFMPLIRRIARSIMRRLPDHVRVDDLEAAGVLGLLQAAQLRDPKRNEQFAAYARRKIEGAMLDELRRADVVPKEVRALSRRIVSAMRVVEVTKGEASEEAVAGELGVSVEAYRAMLERTADVRLLSLEQGSERGGKAAALNVPIEEPSALDVMMEGEACELVTKALRHISPQQRKVLALYYLEDLNMKEIALSMGLSQARVCQIHSEAVHAVRAHIESEEQS